MGFWGDIDQYIPTCNRDWLMIIVQYGDKCTYVYRECLYIF